MASRNRKKLPHGLYPKNFPRSVSWAVDQDYSAKLSPEEKLWLADFNDKFYGAKFAKDAVTDWPTEERRASYIRKNTANSDAYTKCPPEMVEEINHESQRPAVNDPAEAGEDGAWYTHIPIQVGYRSAEPAAGPGDVTPQPDYLESAEYKAAREEFRSHLTKTRREVAPAVTRKFKKAARKLAVVVPSPTEAYIEDEEN